MDQPFLRQQICSPVWPSGKGTMARVVAVVQQKLFGCSNSF
jgi:hypothetical protein